MESNRSGPGLVLLAVAANLLVIVICFAVLGWNNAGAGSATRNTARLASLFFVFGFAGLGLQRWLPAFSEGKWLRAFVAAQMVHFSAVALLHLEFLKDIRSAPILQVAAAVLVGFSLVATVGILPEPRRGLAGAVRIVALHLVFLIFAVDYLKHPIRPLRFMALVYLSALVIRYWPAKRQAMSAAQ